MEVKNTALSKLLSLERISLIQSINQSQKSRILGFPFLGIQFPGWEL